MRRQVWHKMLGRWGRVRRGDWGWAERGSAGNWHLVPEFKFSLRKKKQMCHVGARRMENGTWALRLAAETSVYLHRRLQGSHWSTVLMRIRSKKSHSSWGVNPGASTSCCFSEFLGKERRKVKRGLAGEVESQEGLVLMRRITACLCVLILQRVTW